MNQTNGPLRGLRLLGLLAGLATTFAMPAEAQVQTFISDHPELILSSEQDWGTLGYNVAAHQPDIEGQPLRIGSENYSNGLGHHANGSITLLLNGDYTTFAADVGVHPCQGGSVVFQVFADGELKLKTGPLRSGEAAVPMKIDVRNVQELRLEAKDAGDGITCDMANWANARLEPSSTLQQPRPQPVGLNVAPFGRVATWDPNRADGSRANRLEEFRAEDVFTETELKPNADGSYEVPAYPDGKGCVGIQWLNRRSLRELGIRFSDSALLPNTNSIRVEAWQGESAWQGGWKPLAGDWRINEAEILFQPKGRQQSQKVRWILPKAPTAVRLSAFTHSRWVTTNLWVEIERGAPWQRGKLQIYNGELLTPGRQPHTGEVTSFSLNRAQHFAVSYSQPSSLNSDPTVLRFQLPKGNVAVAVSDLLSNDCVYLPDCGLFVAREPLQVSLADYKRRIASRKTLLEQVRELPDQTFAQAMKKTHHDFQSAGPVMLSLACDNTKFIVERDGNVRFNARGFEWLGTDRQVDWQPWWNSAGEIRPRFGNGTNSSFSRHLDGAWLPIPVNTTVDGGITYVQRTFVAPCTNTPSLGLYVGKSVCVVEFTARNDNLEMASARLVLSFRINAATNAATSFSETAAGLLVTGGTQPFAFITPVTADRSAITTSGAELTWTPELLPGEQRRLVIYLSGEVMQPQEVANFGDVSALRRGTEQYWKGVLDGATQIHTPDARLNDLIRSSQVRCLIDARSEAAGSRIGASIAAMSYGPLESEAHSVIRGMDFLGHHEFARRGLEFFRHRYSTNGFLTTGYTTFGTAWHLWTLGEHYQLTRDTNWIKEIAPELVRACQWIVRQTEKTRRMAPGGNPVPEYGLMPPGVLADWNAFAYHYTMNAYYFAALREVSKALDDIGHPDAMRFALEAERLRKETLRAYAWTQGQSPALPLRDGTWIPHYPSQVHSPGRLAEFFPGQDAGRSWCYDVELGAHQLVPTGVLKPGSREVARMMDHMEDVQFLASGWFDYPADSNQADWFNLGGFSKVQPYYTRNCEIYALRDDVKPFIRSYFNSIASLLNPELLTFWEHFHHSGAWDKTHETGNFLHQTRTMFVQERGDELWLAPYVPADWLTTGRAIQVDSIPTHFGPVSFRIDSHSDQGWIDAAINLSSTRLPRKVVLRLRTSDSRPIHGLKVIGGSGNSVNSKLQTISMRPKAARLELRADY
jgi:hypothetical protein